MPSRARAASIFTLLCAAAPSPAANLYWDINGASAGGSGNTTAPGTWGSGTPWSSAAAGNAPTAAWIADSSAIFCAGANVTGSSQITVSGTQSAAALTFEEGTVSLIGSGSVALTGGGGAGGAPTITLGAGSASRTATIVPTLTAMTPGIPLSVVRGTTGLATLNLQGNESVFLGGMTVDGGVRLNANSSGALGALGAELGGGGPGPAVIVTVTGSGSTMSGATGNGSTPVAITLPNQFVLNPSSSAGFVTGFAAGGSPLTPNKLVFAGNISGASDIYITTTPAAASTGTADANGITVFSGTNTYSGRTVVNVTGDGTFQIGSAGALPPSTALVIGRGQAADNNVGPIDLNGHDISIASLATDTGQSVSRGITNTSAIAGGGITVTGAATTTCAAPIGLVNSTSLNAWGLVGTDHLSLTLAAGHTGTLNLTAANTYTGPTTILGGTLRTSGAGTLGSAGGAVTNHATLHLFNNNALGSVSGTGATTIGDGTTPASVSATHLRQSALTLAAGSAATVNPSGGSPGGVSTIASLSLAPTARLNLKDNTLITNTPAGTAIGTTYTGISGEVQRACHGGLWDGAGGLTTSMPAASAGLTSLGVATGAQLRGLSAGQTALFAGQTITAASTIVLYTYAGDANLDGFISGDDYTALDFSIATPGASGWTNGDFNWDGIISGDDYSMIDFNIVAQGTPFPTGATAGVTAVPEPTTFAAIVAATLFTLHRRRRR